MKCDPPHPYEGKVMHIELPESLASDVEDVYEEAGYTSRTDLIRDATRRRIEQLSK
jgi:metal-responsive CopG/Arc/MetJ family transcriptional regulator